MVIASRAIAGAGNGNVGILRTTVAEMVPYKELQPRAFSIMPLVWNIGSIFGPMVGGALANPWNVQPGERRPHPGLFEMFPYSLPNIVSAVLFTFGITVGILFLKETLDSLQDQRDYGRVLGKKIVKFVKECYAKCVSVLNFRGNKGDKQSGETDPLLKPSTSGEEGIPVEAKEPAPPPPSFREVLHKQSILNLGTYTILAMHSMAYDQLLPVFMQHDPIWAPESTPYSPPLQFAGGIGLNHFRIGLLSTGYGIAGMIIQFFLFPPLCRRFGVLFCFKIVACTFPLVYLITPFTALLPTQESQMGCVFGVMLIKCLCGIFAFPCSTILLTNSASSLRILGTLNGFATSFSALGRAAGPAMAGAMFTVGMNKGYVIASWWLLCAISIFGAIPVFWLIEGEGFGGEDEISDEEETEEEVLEAQALDGQAQASGKPGPLMVPHPEQLEEEEHGEETAYGSITSLTRTNTTASTADPSDDGTGDSRALGQSVSWTATGADSQEQRAAINARPSRRVVRRVSMPIGMGRGISRRYSSNLGQSLGAAGSHHGH